MRKLKFVLGVGALSAALCMGTMMTAMAESRVSNVRLRFDYKEDTDGEIAEPDIYNYYDSYYDVSEVTWSKDVEDWKPGKKVTATVTLSPADDRKFSGSYGKSNCSVTNGDFSSASVNDEGQLVMKASYYPVVQLGQTERAGWSDTTRTRAVWKKVPYATLYQLRLYKDNQHVQTVTLEGNSIDLSQYMTEEASYYYEVRAANKDSSDSRYRKTGEYVLSQNIVLDNLGETGGNWRDYQEGRKYMDEAGNYAADGWRLIQGKWYYFNGDGYAVRGWVNDAGIWYYTGEDYVMRTGWIKVGEIWYCLDEDGVMQTGWVQTQPGQWYYLNPDGSMAVNTTVDGCTLDENGLWVQ